MRITEDLLRKKAEHNDGMLTSLKDIALNQQGIEKIELLNQACRHLTRLYLHNNIIDKIENLHRLKELRYLNLAINNIKVIENLQKCESLRRVDLTLNFIPTSALLESILVLTACYDLSELLLIGNPCCTWHGYREFVIGTLPQLSSLDGVPITEEERKQAQERLPMLVDELKKLDSSSRTHHNTLNNNANCTKEKTATSSSGWCPEARRQDKIALEKLRNGEGNIANKKKEEHSIPPTQYWRYQRAPLHRASFPDIKYSKDNDIIQCNEGNWDFSFDEEEKEDIDSNHTYISSSKERRKRGTCLVFTVNLERHIDINTIQIDIHPFFIRLLVCGRLLQVRFPYEVFAGRAVAQRSNATGKLRVYMPIVSDMAQVIYGFPKEEEDDDARKNKDKINHKLNDNSSISYGDDIPSVH